MGRGLVIGSTRLFASADYLLQIHQQSHRGLNEPADLEGAQPRFRTRAFTEMELSEARTMLMRMGLLPRTPSESRIASETT